MENEMKLVFQQKVAGEEAKLKQSEEELYARHREMREMHWRSRGKSSRTTRRGWRAAVPSRPKRCRKPPRRKAFRCGN